MSNELQLLNNRVVLLVDPTAWRRRFLMLAAQTAINQPLRIVDMGNAFNVASVTRYIRQHTVDVEETLLRMHYRRAFTCYETITALTRTPGDLPVIIPGLLTTFYDESVNITEAFRLLTKAIVEIRRLVSTVPVVVTARPAPRNRPGREGLLSLLTSAVDVVLLSEPQVASAQLGLFEGGQDG